MSGAKITPKFHPSTHEYVVSHTGDGTATITYTPGPTGRIADIDFDTIYPSKIGQTLVSYDMNTGVSIYSYSFEDYTATATVTVKLKDIDDTDSTPTIVDTYEIAISNTKED